MPRIPSAKAARVSLSKPSFVSLAALALVACASHAPPAEEVASTQASLVAELSVEGVAAKVELSPELSNVRHLETRLAAASLEGASASQKAVSFFAAHPRVLGLADARSELRVAKSEESESGTHVRLEETVAGVPVRGGEVTVHFDRDGNLTTVDARIVPGLALAVVPSVSASAAKERAEAEIVQRVAGLTQGDLRVGEAPELVVFAEPGRAPRLAYHLVVRAMTATVAAVLDTTIDALTGEVLEAFDDLETIKVKGAGVLNDEKEFEATQNGTSFTMQDGTRGAPIRTYTAATQQTLPGTLVTTTQQNVWDNVARGKGAAVDAHFYATFVYDYYKTKFARNGIDGRNSPMISTAHFGANYENAFWDGTQMAYGDGGTRFRPLSAGIDVVAHEFTHGVTTSTSRLVYQGQPGALNEAVSDILSTYIEHAYKADDRLNWVTGENVGTNGPIRDLSNPRAKNQPSNMREFVNTQQDNGGVHINSGIPNNAAYLMTMGGTNPFSKVKVGGKLGWEKAEKLWYEVSTKYFQQRTDFAGAATMTVNAATALKYTEAEIAIVKCAWIAVGVMTGPCDPLADGTAPPAGADAGAPAATGDGGATPSGPGTAPAPSGSSKAPAAGGQQELLAEPNEGCNQSGGGAGSAGALVGVTVALAALSRRRRAT